MAQLPVYHSQGGINIDTPNNVRPLDTYAQGSQLLAKTGNMISELAEQWQNSKDEVENLDAKNKLQSGITSILEEANNYNDYKTPAELQAKQDELTQRMNGLTNDIMGGFSNNKKAREFKSNADLAIQQNNIKLQGLFRSKYGDLYSSNLEISANEALKGFTLTGNEAYKNQYFDAIETGVKAGYIDHGTATKLKLSTDDWNYDYVYSQLLNNPYFKASDEVMSKISPTKQRTLQNFRKSQIKSAQADALNNALNTFYLNPTQDNLNAVFKLNPKLKGSKQLLGMLQSPENFEELTNFDGYAEALGAVKDLANMPNDSYDQKMKYIEKAGKVAYKIKLATNEVDDNNNPIISSKEQKKLFELIYKKMQDKAHKEALKNLPDLKNLKVIELNDEFSKIARAEIEQSEKERRKKIAGMVEKGNINLFTRPQVQNEDGTISTVRTMGFNDGKNEVLIPTVSDDGRILSEEEAIAQYRKTGKHLGKFNSVDSAEKYAQDLHLRQEKYYNIKRASDSFYAENDLVSEANRKLTKLQEIKVNSGNEMLECASKGDIKGIQKAYENGLKEAIKVKYWYIPELQNENLQVGQKFTVGGKVYTFQGFSDKDIIVEVN